MDLIAGRYISIGPINEMAVTILTYGLPNQLMVVKRGLALYVSMMMDPTINNFSPG